MEQKGLVNKYTNGSRVLFTMNLTNGVTPFMITVHGEEFISNMYRLNVEVALISSVFFRPTRQQFNKLDESQKMHVLNGGILYSPLATLTELGITDPVPEEFEQFQDWCRKTYSRYITHGN